MKHLYIRSRSDDRVLVEIEADEKSYQGLIRGMRRAIGDNVYIDDSEFGENRVSKRQSEDYFLYFLIAVVILDFILWLLGG